MAGVAGTGSATDEPAPPDWTTLLPRAALVVALVAVAGLTLSARGGLDWDELADPLGVRWARLLVGTAVLLLLAAAARPLLRRLRRPRRPRVPAPGTEPDGEPFPLVLRILAVLLVLATLGTGWYVIDAVAGVGPEVPVPLGPSDRPGRDALGPGAGLRWPVLLGVGALLLAAVTAARVAGRRPAVRPDRVDEDAGADADPGELLAAVSAAETRLGEAPDARTAIVAAYRAMAARIESLLTDTGGTASRANTPTELLERATAAGVLGGAPARTLTALFREARFSRHPMGETERVAAREALAAVRDELTARHG